MKRALILALVIFGALVPAVGVAHAQTDTACQCNEVQAP
jgi:hypothetical protein